MINSSLVVSSTVDTRVRSAKSNKSVIYGKELEALCFVAIFFSSIVGAQLGSISLNTLAPFPLLIYLLIKKKSLKIPVQKAFVWFCLCGSFSALIAMLRPYDDYTAYTSSQIQSIFQMLVVCIPLYCLIRNDKAVIGSLEKNFTRVFRIHVLYAFFQYVCWQFGFDLNRAFIVDILGGLGYESWTFLSNLGTATQANTVLRVSGLNRESAFLGLIILIGIVFESNNWFRLLGIFVILVSMQRTTIVSLIILVMGYLILSRKKRGKKLFDIPAALFIGIVSGILVLLAVFVLSPTVRRDTITLLSRFDFLSNNAADMDLGTLRHILYIPVAIVQLMKLGPSYVLFGIGPKTSGLVFNVAENALSAFLNMTMTSGIVWTIESDIAAVVAGSGFVGLILYLAIFVGLFRSPDKKVQLLAFTLFCFGFMYGFSHLIFGKLLMMFLVSKNEIFQIEAEQTKDINKAAIHRTAI